MILAQMKKAEEKLNAAKTLLEGRFFDDTILPPGSFRLAHVCTRITP